MALVIGDRVKETTTTTGTGTVTLGGAVTGFASFSVVGNSNTTTYAIIAVDSNGVPTGEWETGIGTYTSSGTTLSRGVIASSNSNNLVNFSAGTKHVICADVAGYATPLLMATTANRAIQVADQTALTSAAGNARGSGAVDLQILRSVASRVASGAQSFIGGGSNNTASAYRGGVVCGYRNTSSSQTYAMVCGGAFNTASNSAAFVGGGRYNYATGSHSCVLGGATNYATGAFSSVTGGSYARADKHGQVAHAGGKFAAIGDAQRSFFVARRSTTDATQSELFLNGSSARMTIASDTTWAFEAIVVARRTDADNESAGYLISGCIDNNAGTTALVGTVTVTLLGEDNAAWDVTAEADNTNDALVIKVTGEAAKTVRWVAHVRTAEVTG